MTIKLPALSMSQFDRDTRLLIAISGIFAVSFFGIQMLLKVLYILRLGYGLEYVGLFNAIGALTYMAMSLPSGALGGRFGVRKTMLFGGVITVIGMVIFPLVEFVPLWAQDAWPIISQMILVGGWALLGVNLVPALMAATTTDNRNSAYALTSVLRGLGTLLGTVSGGMLPGLFAYLLGQTLAEPAPYRYALWVGAALGLVALAPLSLIRPIDQVKSETREQPNAPFPVWSIALIALHVYLSHSGWATCQAFCNAYMDTDLYLSPSAIGIITGLGQFAAVLAPLLAPALASRYSNGWILMMTTLGTGISLIPLALAPHWAAAGLGRLGVLALSAMWMPALQVFQMELVDPRWRSLAYGVISMAMGLSFGSMSFAGGYIAAAWGYRSLFLLGVGLNIAGGTLMWFILKAPVVGGLSTKLTKVR